MWTDDLIRERNERVFGATEAPKPKRGRKVTSEAEIARVCTQVLIQDGWRHLKTDPVSRRAWGRGFGEAGMADSLFVRYRVPSPKGTFTMAEFIAEITGVPYAATAEVIWIEWKREDGEAAPHQRKWHERERERGALTLIAGVDFEASVEGFMRFYDASGLRRAAQSERAG